MSIGTKRFKTGDEVIAKLAQGVTKVGKIKSVDGKMATILYRDNKGIIQSIELPLSFLEPLTDG
ncbi:MAG: hypothetical protein ACKVT0_03440 [Planctomycetaceae bacterium]